MNIDPLQNKSLREATRNKFTKLIQRLYLIFAHPKSFERDILHLRRQMKFVSIRLSVLI